MEPGLPAAVQENDAASDPSSEESQDEVIHHIDYNDIIIFMEPKVSLEHK